MTPQDLIQQYVSTGLPIPGYQLQQLTPNMLKTYARQRIITAQQGFNMGTLTYVIKEFEYQYFTKEQLEKYLKLKIDRGLKLEPYEFKGLTDGLRLEYYNKLISQYSSFSELEFMSAPDNIKYEYLSKKIDQLHGVSNIKYYEFEYLPLDLRERYLLKEIINRNKLSDIDLALLTDEQKKDFFTRLYKTDMVLSYQIFAYVDEEVKRNIISDKVKSNKFLLPYEFNFATYEEKKEYINYKLKTNKKLTNYEEKFATDNRII
jgi:hypothetical protein